MAVGLSTHLANRVLDSYCNNTSLAITTPYIKLHVGSPGGAGTSNPAGNTTRMAVSFASAASGAVTTNADLIWLSVSTSETYNHWSLWDASSGGNFLQSGTLTASAVTAGNTFTIPAGDLDLTVSTIAS